MLSVDPGTVTIGIAVWDIDPNTLAIRNIITYTPYVNKDLNMEHRLFYIRNLFINIVEEHQPYMIAHENAFLHRFRPMAYGPLYTIISHLREAFFNNFGMYNVYGYSPKSIKMNMIKGNADKDDMYLAVSSNKELSKYVNQYTDEHQIDAIAIGYTHLINIRKTPELLIT